MYDDLIDMGPDSLSYCLDNDGIWKRIEMTWILESLIEDERFEDCELLKKIMAEHYIAPPEKQEELNVKMTDYFDI